MIYTLKLLLKVARDKTVLFPANDKIYLLHNSTFYVLEPDEAGYVEHLLSEKNLKELEKLLKTLPSFSIKNHSQYCDEEWKTYKKHATCDLVEKLALYLLTE